jgi:hypothetical protein
MATIFAPNCSLLVSNTGGNVQTLPDERVGGKTRNWIEVIALAGSAIADQIMVARLPYGSVPLEIKLNTSTSLVASTIAIGDKNNVSRFSAAGVFTTTNTPTPKLNATTAGVPLTTAYDYLGVSNTNYEDILLTIGISSLPSTGTLVVITEYTDYGA